MFIQIIQAPVADRDALRAQWQRWDEEIRPRATGFLGATAGVTVAGEFLAVARFASEGDARRNSDRPEQGAWWSEVERTLGEAASFTESDDVTVLQEPVGDAGFVQMMQARVRDRGRFEAIEEQIASGFMHLRPDMLGAVRIWLPGSRLHVVDFFTSEAEARAGEQKEMPGEVSALFGEWMSLLEDVRWHDITQPWLQGPAS